MSIKTITPEQLDQALYDVTYENGVTFGICGNADYTYKKQLADRLNKHFGEDSHSELEKAVEDVKKRNEKEFGWQPKDVAEIPPAVPGQGAKL